MQGYRKIFEMMIMEETLAQLMQGSEATDITLARPAVLMSSAHVCPRPMHDPGLRSHPRPSKLPHTHAPLVLHKCHPCTQSQSSLCA